MVFQSSFGMDGSTRAEMSEKQIFETEQMWETEPFAGCLGCIHCSTNTKGVDLSSASLKVTLKPRIVTAWIKNQSQTQFTGQFV